MLEGRLLALFGMLDTPEESSIERQVSYRDRSLTC
jgi:hypothetical protein